MFPSLLLLLAALTLLGSTLYRQKLLAARTRHPTVLDLAMGRVVTAHPPRHSQVSKTWALHQGLHLLFRWGRFYRQPKRMLRTRVRSFWKKPFLSAEVAQLVDQSLTIKKLYMGPNYAKVFFHQTGKILQINFWQIKTVPPTRANPFGFRFHARFILEDNTGFY